MIPTPDLSHLTKEDYEHVYEPAEDTFLLLDALEEDAHSLRELSPKLCVEIGSGSGCVSTFAGKILGPSSCLFLCTDINARASLCTCRTGAHNKVPLEPIVASLTGPFNQRLHGNVDLLLFNPPYVPTVSEEANIAQQDRDIAGSWAGGLLGMNVTTFVLDNLKYILSDRGIFYLVALKENDIPSIQRRMKDDGFESKIVMQRRAGREHLFILRFSKTVQEHLFADNQEIVS